jgi:WhiB family redox-sensing transcriptional regulator
VSQGVPARVFAQPVPAWFRNAVCKGVDPELFFAVIPGPDGYVEAKAVCAGCPVAADCLEYAIENNELYGVFGGVTAHDRKVLVAQRNRGAA